MVQSNGDMWPALWGPEPLYAAWLYAFLLRWTRLALTAGRLADVADLRAVSEQPWKLPTTIAYDVSMCYPWRDLPGKTLLSYTETIIYSIPPFDGMRHTWYLTNLNFWFLLYKIYRSYDTTTTLLKNCHFWVVWKKERIFGILDRMTYNWASKTEKKKEYFASRVS